jgi:hypothetical protein
MAVSGFEVGGKKVLKLASATVATLVALPGTLLAQAQRMSSDWLQLSPSDAKAGITVGGENSTSAPIPTAPERRKGFRSRADSVAGTAAYEASKRDQNLHIVVSLDDRKLWVVAGVDTVLQAPVAIGTGDRLVFGEKAWKFDTPRGIRSVRGKDADPKWVPPEWHYVETAKEHGLKLATLSMNKPTKISGGRKIAFRDGEAGVIHPDSGFAFLPLEEEIVFDNTLFVPPVESKNRKVQGALGKYKLDMGAGFLLHGTPDQGSIGTAATHGCLRLRDEDIEWLYQYVPVGTRIYIY